MLGARGWLRDDYARDPYRIPEPLRGPRRLPGERSAGALDPLLVQAQVIVVDPERRCRDYAEMFLGKLKKIGLVCDIIILDKFLSPSQVIEEATARGLLYTASVTMQNEMHLSITVNILQGQPQEHRNMPYEDALKLVARNFDAHLLKLGGGKTDAAAAPAKMPLASKALQIEEIDPKLSLMLINLAEGKNLKLDDLDLVIEFLKKKREKLTGIENPGQPIATTYQQKESKPASTGPSPVQPPSPKEKIASTQAEDLQAKINRLFGDQNKQQSTVRMKLSASPQADDNYTAQADSKKKNPVGIDFTNPSVQNALQNLMKTGPSILDSLSRGSQNSHGTSNAMTTSNTPRRSESPTPPKRAKPGKHVIAGFY